LNNYLQQEIRYRLLKFLCEERGLTQRDMAKRMGISLGKMNYCLSEFAGKGLGETVSIFLSCGNGFIKRLRMYHFIF